VLDSFLGSGTTAAVAQKMGRRYIGIEMGEHAITHCVPRMKAVIDGEQGGISKTVNWNGGGGYTFYDLGETIFDENGNINEQVNFKTLASHVWFTETKTPLLNYEKSPLLGIHNGVAYYLLFNGILGDKKPDGGNVLTQKVLDSLPRYDGKKVIYGEATRMNAEKLKVNNIVFKQTPYEIKAR
jgi:adenine-specific DNA-methyltransferase